MSSFVLVPGAWLGGWCWRDAAAALRAMGHFVTAVTLTGLGERAHLLNPGVGLATHVGDVGGILHWRDMRDVVLVGHSYGGTVITAAAEEHHERIRGLVYIDASVPQDGQSNSDALGQAMAAAIRAAAGGDGWRLPPPSVARWGLSAGLQAWVEERLTPHPLLSLEQPVHLASPAAAALPRAFLRSSESSGPYARLMERGRRAGWTCADIGGGHYPMLTRPHLVAAALAGLPTEQWA